MCSYILIWLRLKSVVASLAPAPHLAVFEARIERKTGIELELAEQEEALPPLAKRGKPRRKQPSRPRAESPESEGKAVKSRLRRP